MALLKDTLVTGNLLVTNTIFSESARILTIIASTSDTETVYGAGTNGLVLKTNGTNIFWGNSGVTSVRVQAASPLLSSVDTAQTSSLNTTISFVALTHNTVLAGPAGTSDSNAAPTFRSLTANDIPNLSTSKLTSGTLEVKRGGTGATTFTADCVIVGNGTGAMASRGLKVTGATTDNVILTCASTDKTLKLSSTSTLYLNSKTGTSIVFLLNDSEIARFNINGNLALGVKTDSTAIGTQNTHKLYVSGNSCFNGKIAFGALASNAITEKAYILYLNGAIQLSAKAINFPTITNGTGVTASDLGASADPRYRPASWKYNAGITPIDGDIVTVKIPSAAHDYGTWLSLDNGTTYYPIIHSNGSRLLSWFSNNMSITLRYDSAATCSVFGAVSGTSIIASNARATANGCWRLITLFDTGNDLGLRVYRQKSGYNADYPLLVSRTAMTSSGGIGTGGTNSSYTNTIYGVVWDDITKVPTLNPSTGLMKVPGGIEANVTGHASEDLKAANIKSYNKTLTSSNWNSATLNITIPGANFEASDTLIIGPQGTATEGVHTAIISAGLEFTQYDGTTITVKAFGEVPTVNIPITIVLMKGVQTSS